MSEIRTEDGARTLCTVEAAILRGSSEKDAEESNLGFSIPVGRI